MRRCPVPNSRSSRGPAISRSTTTPTASSRSSSGSSIPPSPPVYDQTRFANCCAPASANGRHRVRRHPGRGARCDGRGRAQRHLIVVRRDVVHRVMAIDVTVLRVFTDRQATSATPSGWSTPLPSTRTPPARRHRIGLQRNNFRRLSRGRRHHRRARIFTPVTELPFAGHPTVGASWWLRPGHAGQHPAGAGRHRSGALRRRPDRDQRPRRMGARVRHPRPGQRRRAGRRRPRRLPRRRRALSVDMDRPAAGTLRSRMFAANLGMPEDEATGAAAVRITDYLEPRPGHHAGQGFADRTTWSPEGGCGSPAESSTTVCSGCLSSRDAVSLKGDAAEAVRPHPSARSSPARRRQAGTAGPGMSLPWRSGWRPTWVVVISSSTVAPSATYRPASISVIPLGCASTSSTSLCRGTPR